MEDKWREWLRKLQRGKENKKKISWEDIGFSRLLIIVLAGIFLLVLSFPQENSSEKKEKKTEQKEVLTEENDSQIWNAMDTYAKEQEHKVEEILSSVEGIGEVDVMVTMAASEEKITLKDEENTQDATQEQDSNGGSRIQSNSSLQEETILVQQEEGEEPYVVEIQSPEIEGIVVVAQGAGSAATDTEIVEAIVALFPVETHKIKVMKMK